VPLLRRPALEKELGGDTTCYVSGDPLTKEGRKHQEAFRRELNTHNPDTPSTRPDVIPHGASVTQMKSFLMGALTG